MRLNSIQPGMLTARANPREHGLTFVELIVTVAILSILAMAALPVARFQVKRQNERELRRDLWMMRDAIDKYFADHGRYPDSLEDLVAKRYLRAVPVDPITQKSSSWVVNPPEDTTLGAVYDVRSGAPNKARDGTAYKEW